MTNRQLAWLLACAIAGGLLLLLGVLQLTVPSTSNSLHNVSPECVVRNDQCEQIAQTRILAEPENTLSNLAYLAAGIAIVVRSWRAGFDRRRVPALMVGVSFCFLALCSGYYHATLNDIPAAGRLPNCNPNATKLPQYLDIVGVYLSLLSMICYGLDRLMRKRIEVGPLGVLTILVAIVVALLAWFVPGAIAAPKHWVMTGVAIWLVCGIWAGAIGAMVRCNPAGWVVWVVWGVMLLFNAVFSGAMRMSFGFDSDLVFPVLVGLLLGVAAMNVVLPSTPASPPWRLSLGELGLVLSAFTAGIVVRVLDGRESGTGLPKPLCNAETVLQAHAFWHLLSAAALLLTFDLIEKSSVSNVPDDVGPALLPASGSVATWLARPGATLGRRLPALLFNIGFSLATLMFAVVMLIHPGAASIAALVPVLAAAHLWLVTYTDVTLVSWLFTMPARLK